MSEFISKIYKQFSAYPNIQNESQDSLLAKELDLEDASLNPPQP